MALNLLELPGEMQNEIVSHLDGAGMLFLAATCRHFRQTIPLEVPQLTQLVERSELAIRREAITCGTCKYLKHRFRFADKVAQCPLSAAHLRKCLDCQLHPATGSPHYTLGSHVKVAGIRHVVCLRCRELRVAAQRPAKLDDGLDDTKLIPFDNRLCGVCWKPYKIQNKLVRREMEVVRQREWSVEVGSAEAKSEEHVPATWMRRIWIDEYTD